MEQFGKLVEDGFWMDSVRTHCYATYESVEQVRLVRER
jgi:hypothetical protein